MENITTTVKEKMQKVYSFTGTQLLITWLGVVILLGIFACVGRGHGWPRSMMNYGMRWWKQEMMQQYDRQGNNWKQKQGMMMRWQQTNQDINNQGQPKPMMNWDQNSQPTINQNQPNPLSVPTGTGN